MSVTTDERDGMDHVPLAPGPIGIVIYVWRRARQGELGPIPVILGLVAVWSYFQIANDRFLSSGNLTNLMMQIAAMGTISVGVVLVLLLGEIDLSVAYVSGLAAATMAVRRMLRSISRTTS